MRMEVGGPIIAQHQDHLWVVDGERFPRLDCARPASVHFERADGMRSKIYAPLKHVSFIDGVAYADRQVFAFVDRSIGDWYCHDDGRHYAVMIVQAA